MEKTIISTKNAPSAIGPYSQAIMANGMVYTSGQLPLNPADGKLVTDDIKKATKQSLDNLRSILEEAGTDLSKVIKTTVFLKNLDDFVAVNEVYGEYFSERSPARSCVQVAKLPMDALVEIEAVAIL